MNYLRHKSMLFLMLAYSMAIGFTIDCMDILPLLQVDAQPVNVSNEDILKGLKAPGFEGQLRTNIVSLLIKGMLGCDFTRSYVFRVPYSSVSSVVVSCDGNTVLISRSNGKAQKWNPEKGTLLELERYGNSTTVAFGPNEETFFVGYREGLVVQYDTKTGDVLNQIILQHKNESSKEENSIKRVVLSSHETALLYSKETVYLCDVKTGKKLHEFTGFSNGEAIRSVALSSKKDLAIGLEDGRVLIYEIGTEKRPVVLEGHTQSITSVNFNPDGTKLLTCSIDASARVWDVTTRTRLLHITSGHQQQWVFSGVFSPDGETFLIGLRNGEANLYATKTGNLLQTLDHDIYDGRPVVAFCPNENTVVTANNNGEVRLWTIEAGKKLQQQEGPIDPAYSVVIRPESPTVLTGSADLRVTRNTVLYELFKKFYPMIRNILAERKIFLESLTQEELVAMVIQLQDQLVKFDQ